MAAGSHPLFALVDFRNTGRTRAARHPQGGAGRGRPPAVRGDPRAPRRRTTHERTDVLSLLLQARDEEGEPLTDHELRDELMSLILAGHETTANSLAWTFERLLRTPAAYDRLRETVRGDDREAADAYVEATIHEGMRMRPVIPMIVPRRQAPVAARRVRRAGRHAGGDEHRRGPPPRGRLRAARSRSSPSGSSTRKPGTYTWFPFGGGIRRCLGATLAMAEQRVVLEAIARRTDLRAPDLTPEQPAPAQRDDDPRPGRPGRRRAAHGLARWTSTDHRAAADRRDGDVDRAAGLPRDDGRRRGAAGADLAPDVLRALRRPRGVLPGPVRRHQRRDDGPDRRRGPPRAPARAAGRRGARRLHRQRQRPPARCTRASCASCRASARPAPSASWR